MHTRRKRGAKTLPLRYYCYKCRAPIPPPIIMFMEKRVHLGHSPAAGVQKVEVEYVQTFIAVS